MSDLCEYDESSDEYDDDDDDDGMMDVDENQTSQEPEKVFQVLTQKEVMTTMLKTIHEVSSLIELPPTVIRNLLNSLKWDSPKLCEQFYDRRAQLFKEAKITDPATVAKPAEIAKRHMCEICFDTKDKKHFFSTNCGHYFCNDCWEQYLEAKILGEGSSECIFCPAPNCSVIVEDSSVLTLITSPDLQERFQKILVDTYVHCNALLRHCPSPDCQNVLQVEENGMKCVLCTCNYQFCFACGEDWHCPIKCDLLKEWKKKNQDDSETSNWIAVNTKDCPKCRVTIEKDGGCNHMICRNTSCKFEFCWVCLGQWSNHGTMWYNCVRYDEEESRQNRSSVDASRAALNRYIFYFNRYANHMESLKFERKLHESVRENMNNIMIRRSMSWIDLQFLTKAVDVLCSCRKTLMYTYVFSFYLERNNESAIFEENQRDLQEATELLSGYLERDMSELNLSDFKQQIQHQLRYCENRQQVLLDHVSEGHENDKWRFPKL